MSLLSPEQAKHLYEEAGLSIDRIAAISGLGRSAARTLLQSAGVTFRPRGITSPIAKERAAHMGRTSFNIGDGQSTREQHDKHVSQVLNANPDGFEGHWSARPGGRLYKGDSNVIRPPSYHRSALR